MTKKIIYTPEEISDMPTAALRKLLQHVEDRGVQRTIDAVTAELAERPLREGGKVACKHVSAIKQTGDGIVRVHLRLAKKFDLSPQSANTKHPHKMLSAQGGAKAGGDMLRGDVASGYYVSYRNGDNVASFGIMLKSNSEEPFIYVSLNADVKRYAIGQFEDAAAQYEAIIYLIVVSSEGRRKLLELLDIYNARLDFYRENAESPQTKGDG